MGRVTKNLSLITFYVFVVGYLYNASYYEVFHINILNYLTNIEVFYSLLPISIVIMFCLQFFNTKIKEENEEKKFNLFNSKIEMFLMLFLASVSFALMIFAILGKGFKGEDHLLLLIFTTNIFLLLRFTSIFRINNEEVSKYLFSILVLIALSSYLFGFSKAILNQKWGAHTHYCIKKKNEVINTNDSLIVIGETQSSIFLFNMHDTTTRIIKREQIDSLVIK